MRKPTFGGYKPPKPVRVLKYKPEPPKNLAQAGHNQEKGIAALRGKLCLSLRYHDLPRTVEVHTVGITTNDRPAMRVWQVSGQSESGSPERFRTMCFDECFDVSLTDLPSAAPRPDYKKGDKAFKIILAEV